MMHMVIDRKLCDSGHDLFNSYGFYFIFNFTNRTAHSHWSILQMNYLHPRAINNGKRI
jgi:hypothetical protein